jgi:hypothetical protein
MRSLAIALFIGLAPLPAFADGFLSSNRLFVTPSGPQSFDVGYVPRRNSASAVWCAAGDFVIFGLRMSATTQVYRTSSADPPRRGRPTSFSLRDANAVDSGLSRFGNASIGMTAAAAQALCEPFPLFPDFL